MASRLQSIDDSEAQSASFDADERLSLRLWLQLMKCTKEIEADAARHLRRDHNQSLARFDVLSQLYRFDGWVAIGEVASRLMTSSGNITALLDRMAAEGLVERRPSPTDRRSFQIRMTRLGRKTFDRLTADHAAWVDTALADVSDADKRRLIDLLTRVRKSYDGARTDDLSPATDTPK